MKTGSVLTRVCVSNTRARGDDGRGKRATRRGFLEEGPDSEGPTQNQGHPTTSPSNENSWGKKDQNSVVTNN